MQSKEVICPQCHNATVVPTNRLVQDNCGHVKCRSCLLSDTEFCKQCVKSSNNGLPVEDIVKEITDNHTAVICNGRAQTETLNSVIDSVANNSEDLAKQTLPNGSLETGDSECVTAEENSISKKVVLIPAHIITKTDPACYFCTLCNKSFATKTHIKYHRYCNGDKKPFKCDKCGKDFILKVQFQTHMWKHDGTKPHKCMTCSKVFSERSKLMRHTALHSANKCFTCTDCGKSFKVKDSLRVHSLIHKTEKPYGCTICSAKFSNSSNLKKHLVSHSDEKVHMCDQCGRRFKLKSALSVHRKSHLNIRPHVCKVCTKSFVNHKDLQRHSLIHSDVKQFSCSICMTTFRRKDMLGRHMKNTHPGKKGEIIRNPLPVSDLPKKSVVIDNPNAVNVITASPALTKCRADPTAVPVQPPSTISTDSRPTGSVINAPIKLAFKTPAFKSHYNITGGRPSLPSSQLSTLVPGSLDPPEPSRFYGQISEPQKAAAPPPLVSTSHQDLTSYSSVLHYETSFQSGKHGMIKNIKFKVPACYTNSFKTTSNNNQPDDGDSKTGNASVIVNNSAVVSSDIHWRRRTSQNLVLKN